MTLRTNSLIACVISALCALTIAGCGSKDPNASLEPLESLYPHVYFADYPCAEGYTSEYRLVDMTVAQVVEEMDAGRSFVVLTGFKDCPWCNAILNSFNDVLTERGIYAAYIDTRKDPEWQSNLDLADYDLFVERFGSALPVDDEGRPHLYVPHAFFVSDGKLVADRSGTVPGQQSPKDPLTDEQVEEYKSAVNANLDAIGI